MSYLQGSYLRIYREMAVGNTFGATALSSYGGFWLSFAIILTPGGFQIVESLEAAGAPTFTTSFSFFLFVSRDQAVTITVH